MPATFAPDWQRPRRCHLDTAQAGQFHGGVLDQRRIDLFAFKKLDQPGLAINGDQRFWSERCPETRRAASIVFAIRPRFSLPGLFARLGPSPAGSRIWA